MVNHEDVTGAVNLVCDAHLHRNCLVPRFCFSTHHTNCANCKGKHQAVTDACPRRKAELAKLSKAKGLQNSYYAVKPKGSTQSTASRTKFFFPPPSTTIPSSIINPNTTAAQKEGEITLIAVLTNKQPTPLKTDDQARRIWLTNDSSNDIDRLRPMKEKMKNICSFNKQLLAERAEMMEVIRNFKLKSNDKRRKLESFQKALSQSLWYPI